MRVVRSKGSTTIVGTVTEHCHRHATLERTAGLGLNLASMELLIGVGLLAASVRTWIRHTTGPRMAPALLLGALDRLTPTRSAGAGVVISGANPKVLALALGEALAVTAAGADPDARTPS